MLTDTQCRNAKPKAKPYKLADSNGLHLEVKPNGTKAWRYRFKLGSGSDAKEGLFAIGDYGPAQAGETPDQAVMRRRGGCLTLAEAREERAKARALVTQGINPAHQRQLDRIRRQQESVTTFEGVAREWITLRTWTDQTKARRLDMLARVVFPKIGGLPIRSVQPAHVLDVLQKAAEKNGPTVAAEAKRTMSCVFELAVSTLRADTDPVYPVRRALPANKTQHKRALTAEEIGRFQRDLDGYERNVQTVAAFRLMWWTLRRPNEVTGAQWAEIDLGAATWRIPADRMKKRRDHTVPLPRQAVELLRTMHALTGGHQHVFPHRDDRSQPMTDATMRQALKQLGWAGTYSPHATRTTGSTRLNEMGYPADWIERQLAHTEANAVRRTYNHADYLVDRTAMMQQWADYLDALRQGAKIVPIKKRTLPIYGEETRATQA
ncbi:tyrosine-type recombinase/integrase [Cupriavidus basilensis]|uniref:tyrosine-type recombinase/integrase n=1 Tax=Cupriavidus basilensis TaxID=68895 RepID=UPI0020A62212|nr:tyrosine-type recombinase/integrase [Cupriavidus basilensis]MCP3019634.1 tyrosine-type recombinase/integrase [Cupriavidus basilensis]